MRARHVQKMWRAFVVVVIHFSIDSWAPWIVEVLGTLLILLINARLPLGQRGMDLVISLEQWKSKVNVLRNMQMETLLHIRHMENVGLTGDQVPYREAIQRLLVIQQYLEELEEK